MTVDEYRDGLREASELAQALDLRVGKLTSELQDARTTIAEMERLLVLKSDEISELARYLTEARAERDGYREQNQALIGSLPPRADGAELQAALERIAELESLNAELMKDVLESSNDLGDSQIDRIAVKAENKRLTEELAAARTPPDNQPGPAYPNPPADPWLTELSAPLKPPPRPDLAELFGVPDRAQATIGITLSITIPPVPAEPEPDDLLAGMGLGETGPDLPGP